MSYEMKLEQGLSQQLNQFQMQSLNILSFDNYELEKFLQDEYAENPLMEHKESEKEFLHCVEMQADIRILNKVILKIRKLKIPKLFYGTVKCKKIIQRKSGMS